MHRSLLLLPNLHGPAVRRQQKSLSFFHLAALARTVPELAPLLVLQPRVPVRRRRQRGDVRALPAPRALRPLRVETQDAFESVHARRGRRAADQQWHRRDFDDYVFQPDLLRRLGLGLGLGPRMKILDFWICENWAKKLRKFPRKFCTRENSENFRLWAFFCNWQWEDSLVQVDCIVLSMLHVL